MKLKVGRLHVITDTVLQSKYSHAEIAKMAIDGGADTIQFRSKTGSGKSLYSEAEKVAHICKDSGITFIINDRIDIAQAVEADGVHLGQTDIPIPVARKIMGNDALIGGSAVDLEEVRAVIESKADYVGFGPAFTTGSKEDAGTPRGLEYLKEIVENSSIPIIAIGGINSGNVSELMKTGIHGIAVISAVCCAVDPTAATRDLVTALRKIIPATTSR
jgi:thiamine-phosphate pyrophosphorylase